MNLSFENLDELNQFLNWANLYRTHDAGAPAEPYPAIDTHALDPDATGVPGVDYPALTADRVPQLREDPQPAVSAEDKPTRKRRTKAEIEADAKAAGLAARKVAEQVDETKIERDPAIVTPAPTGGNPFEQVATETASTDDKPAEEPNAEPEVVTPFQHLTRAREFIAKHGMPKYNESFTKAGLDPNVMGYTAYQRSLHLAALDGLEKA